MLTTLLESRSCRARDNRGTIASVTVHAAIIFAAVYATAAGAPTKDKPGDSVVIHWVPTPPPRSAATTILPEGPARAATLIPIARPVTVPIQIPTSLPAIDVQLSAVTPADFPRSSTGDPGLPDRSHPGALGGDRASRAYDVSEVETPVSAIGNAVPDYPPALRALGIDGKVVAEFVVTEFGRADGRSLRIISASNEAFVESIRRALPRMRFSPAKIGGRSVPQLVQQQFLFRLDR